MSAPMRSCQILLLDLVALATRIVFDRTLRYSLPVRRWFIDSTTQAKSCRHILLLEPSYFLLSTSIRIIRHFGLAIWKLVRFIMWILPLAIPLQPSALALAL